MRKVKWISGIGTVLALAAGCWFSGGCAPSAPVATSTPAPEAAPPGPLPRAVADELEHDFGSLKIGETGRHVFTIRNEGQGPLEIKTGRTTCKCTLSRLSRDVVAPGESTEVELSWSIKEEKPEFQQQAEILTNDPDHKAIHFTVRGKVVFALVLTPTRIWTFPDLGDEKPVTVSGTLHSPLYDAFQIVSTSTGNPLFRIDTSPLDAAQLAELSAKSGYAVAVTVSPGMPVGEFQETGLIRTDVEGGTDVPLDFVGQRSGPISVFGPKWNVTGQYLGLGTLDPSKGVTASVSLFVRGGPDELQFLSVKSDPPGLGVTLEKDRNFKGEANRQRYVLRFELPAGLPRGARDGENPARINVTTNHPEAGSVVFRIHYNAVGR